MGEIKRVICDCGFKKQRLYTWFGFHSDSENPKAVVVCRDCWKVGTSGYLKSAPTCAHCGSTNVDLAALPPGPERDEVLKRGSDRLVDYRGYLTCPRCKKRTLEVLHTGDWD